MSTLIKNCMGIFWMKSFRLFFLIPSGLLVMLMSCEKKDQTYVNYVNSAGVYNGDALAYFQSQQGVYDSFLLLINRLPGAADSVRTGNYTIFAPSNRSFTIALQNINQARRDSVPQLPPTSFSKIDVAVLDTFFSKYLIPGKIKSTDLAGRADGLEYESMKFGYPMQLQYRSTNASGYEGGGPKAIVFSDRRGSVFTVNWIRVNTITVDIQTTNAVIHALDPGHTFGFGNDFVKALNSK